MTAKLLSEEACRSARRGLAGILPTPDAPSHGLARTAEWTLDHASETEEETQLGFGLELPGLKLSYTVLLSHSLKLVLEITNIGEAERRVEAALHTYLAVSDAREVTITGLENVAYLDKVGGPTQADATGEPIRFVDETDRVYGDTDDDVVLHDPGLKRQITVAKAGGRSTIVWNPWVDKAARMKDFGDDEWTGMCCHRECCGGRRCMGAGLGHDQVATSRSERRCTVTTGYFCNFLGGPKRGLSLG